MEIRPETIEKLTPQEFRRFGIACCHRLGCGSKDKRLAKALRMLEKAVRLNNERIRRDALNAASSVYCELCEKSQAPVIRAIACTLVCACSDGPNVNLLGNFYLALSKGERLSSSEIEKIQLELYEQAKKS